MHPPEKKLSYRIEKEQVWLDNKISMLKIIQTMVFKDDFSLGEEIIIGVLNSFPNFELNLREFYEMLIEIPEDKHTK